MIKKLLQIMCSGLQPGGREQQVPVGVSAWLKWVSVSPETNRNKK